jgi:hypothetical protein
MKEVFVPCNNHMKGENHVTKFSKLLVITCLHSDYTFLIPVISEINTQGVIDIFEKWIFPTTGYPQSLVTDQDPLFMSAKFQDWLAGKGIRHKASSAYHPQTDGASERKNRTIIPMFTAMELEGMNWVEAAPYVQTKVNNRYSSSRKESPFHTIYGFQPRFTTTPLPIPIHSFSDPAKRHYEVAENLTQAKHKQILHANKHRTASPNYKVGDKVLLSTKNLPERYQNNKLTPRWFGPFTITNVYEWRQSYELDLSEYPDLLNISNCFHTSLIKPYRENLHDLFPTRTLAQPGPVESDRWEVEKVLEMRSQPKTGTIQYKVRWTGWGPSHDSWQKASNIDQGLLEEFWKNGNKASTFKRRPVGNKDKKRKTREETLKMINDEKMRVLKGKEVDVNTAYLRVPAPPTLKRSISIYPDDIMILMEEGKISYNNEPLQHPIPVKPSKKFQDSIQQWFSDIVEGLN